ncbi:MAG: hypothetical protein GY700_06545 [Propionibacteriaceae bacterium]|nr:hypothetical protein [Propionibacteriaceae bacterium]
MTIDQDSFREALEEMFADEISALDPDLVRHADGRVGWQWSGHELESGESSVPLESIDMWIFASGEDYESDPQRWAREIAADADVRAAIAVMFEQSEVRS